MNNDIGKGNTLILILSSQTLINYHYSGHLSQLKCFTSPLLHLFRVGFFKGLKNTDMQNEGMQVVTHGKKYATELIFFSFLQQ